MKLREVLVNLHEKYAELGILGEDEKDAFATLFATLVMENTLNEPSGMTLEPLY